MERKFDATNFLSVNKLRCREIQYLQLELNGMNCAEHFTGAWWYNDCGGLSSNGQNFINATAPLFQGIVYSAFRGFAHSLKNVPIAIQAI